MAIILIVDDDAAMRDALAEVVHDLGHDARLAPSGEEALRVAERETLNAVFLDLRMPGMDGLEVLRRLRARPRPVAVTILTAHATATNTIEAMRLGAFDHLTKPIGREDVARVLERMLASTAMPRSARPPAEAEALIGASAAMREVQKTIVLLSSNPTGMGESDERQSEHSGDDCDWRPARRAAERGSLSVFPRLA